MTVTLADPPEPGWAPYQPVLEDKTLPHQIVIRGVDGHHLIGVGCNCLGSMNIIVRATLPADKALAAWRDFHEGSPVTR